MSNLPKLPPDRIYFSEIKTLLGISTATLRRRYRPWKDEAARIRWTTTLDIRENAQGYLHCSRAAVEVLVADARGGRLATGRSVRSDSLPFNRLADADQASMMDCGGEH